MDDKSTEKGEIN